MSYVLPKQVGTGSNRRAPSGGSAGILREKLDMMAAQLHYWATPLVIVSFETVALADLEALLSLRSLLKSKSSMYASRHIQIVK